MDDLEIEYINEMLDIVDKITYKAWLENRIKIYSDELEKENKSHCK